MFSTRLKKLRERKKISQSALSKLLFVSQQTVGKWETGLSSPNPEMIAKIADVLETSTDYLLCKSDEPTTQKREANDNDIMFALFGGAEGITQKDIDDVKNFANFIKEQKKKQ